MRSFQDCLPAVLKSVASRPEVALLLIRELWPQIVGPGLARNVEPVQLEGHRLVLQVGDPVWKAQVEELRSLIMSAINDRWGCRLVERIEVGFRPK